MSKFKVGDKVRVVADKGDCGTSNSYDDTYYLVLTAVSNSNHNYTVHSADGRKVDSCNCYGDKNLELIDSAVKTIMTNIKTFVKNMSLSADEKALRQAGLKAETGEYTQEAIDVVLQSLCAEQESKLVAIAQGIIAEEAKTK